MENNNDNDTQNELQIKAVESSLEWSKQIITLATGTLVISGTFIKIFQDQVVWAPAIITCWIAMCVSLLFGLFYIGSLCSRFNERNIDKLDIYSSTGQYIAIAQFSTFFIGIIAFLAFIAKNL